MERQQRNFEAWAKKNGFSDFDFRGGGYSSPATSGAWRVWRHFTPEQVLCGEGDCSYYGQKPPSTCCCAKDLA